MIIVKNARGIALRSYSMWSIYLGVLCFNASDVLYKYFEYETDPAMWTMIGNALFIGGALGRLVHQQSIPDD